MTQFGFKIEDIKVLAELAGREIMEVYQTDFEKSVVFKEDESPLTLADKRSNQVIVEGLKRLPVKYPIISEEINIPRYEQRKDMDIYWLIDPLDGTREFVNRNGDFTVNIALIQKNRPVFGCIQVPVSGDIYWGSKGEGSFLERNGMVRKITARSFSIKDSGLQVLASRSHLSAATKEFVSKLKDPEFIARGSSLKMMMIAEGEADIYPRMGPTMEWDTAAAQIILEEADGSILKADDRKPLVYNKEDLLNPWFIANAKIISS